MIRELSQILNEFTKSMNKEIKNIKKIIHLNERGNSKEYETLKKINKNVNRHLQEIILHQKEINQKWDSIGSFIEGMIKEYIETPHKATTNSNYLKYNKYIRERRNQKFLPITKAILNDKYIANKARIVAKKRKT